jgi:hypothetical protein
MFYHLLSGTCKNKGKMKIPLTWKSPCPITAVLGVYILSTEGINMPKQKPDFEI